MEKQLALLWASVLQREADNLSMYDNFFELGGHSLLATRLRSAIMQQFKVEYGLQAIFQQPTLAAMAQAIGQSKAAALQLTLKPRPKQLPLSFAQQRLWFLDQLLEQKSVYNIPHALELKGELNLPALEQAFQQVIIRQESLRTLFRTTAGHAEQIILPKVDFTLRVVNSHEIKTIKTYIQNEAERRFDLSQGPLLRAQILQLDNHLHILLLTLHHIITDGWSNGILLKEIGRYYEAALKSEEPMLAPLPLQYADYALWQRDYLQGEVLAKQLAYWQKQFIDVPEALTLPTDKPRPQVMSYQGSEYRFSLPPEVTSLLKRLGQQEGATLFMTLLTAFQILLYRYSDQTDIVVGTPIANRQHHELEGLIGFFINTLALRSQLNPEQGFRALLKQVKQTTLAAYNHQDLPFEQLVEHLKLARDLSRSPLFQVMLVLQNNAEASLSLQGLQTTALPMGQTTAKFDASTLDSTRSPA